MNTIMHEVPSDLATSVKISQKIKRMFPVGCNRILLVNVPQVAEEDFDLATARLGRNTCPPPYGLGLLSRSLQTAGYATKLVDLNYTLLSQVSSDSFHYDIWEKELKQTIESFKPDMIGITCMFSMTHDSFAKVAVYLKTHYPHLALIAGGVHVTNNTRLILEGIPQIDLVVRYEADNAIVFLVDFVNGKVNNDHLTQIAVIYEGEYLQLERRDIPNETALNLSPDYDDLPIGKFSSVGKIGGYFWLRPDVPMATALSTRGCRANCTFCSVANFNGRGTRSRGIPAVVDEMERTVELYGVRHFMWLDDDLFRPNHAIVLFNEITRRNLGITWDASNGVIASASTSEVIHAAAESGCIGLTFGIESGDPDILKAVKKPSGVKHFRMVGDIMKGYPHIFNKGYLMIGFPEETVAQIQRTIDL